MDVTPLRPRFGLLLSAVLAVAALVWLVVVIGQALPPRSIVMTTGAPGDADEALGKRYRAVLARQGVDLKLVPSAGKVENLARLRDPKSGFAVGFASGGLTTADRAPGVVSLGTISYDPLWVFCRDLPDPPQFQDLVGKRVSIGLEGSGTRALVLELLRLNRMEGRIEPVALSPAASGDALRRGEIACACMLTTAEAPEVQRLLADERVSVIGFPRADAYVALLPFLRKVTLPMGVGDLAANRPPHDVTLVAAAESLLVREKLHPAMQFLLLQAADEIHSGAGIFQKPGQFPAPERVDVPLSDEARPFYKSGGTFFQRHLPFWLWVFATRALLILIPLAGLVYPLAQLIPAAVAFEVHHRLSRLYGELRGIETRIGAPGFAAADIVRDLERFEEKIRRTRVPQWHAQALYTLKQHAGLVRDRFLRSGAGPGGPDPSG